MSQDSAENAPSQQDRPGSADGGAVSRPQAQSDDRLRLPPGPPRVTTTLSHQGLTLIGVSFFVFELGYIVLLCDKSWFTIDMTWLGAPAVLAAMVISHILLILMESPAAVQACRLIKKGMPAVFYRKWLYLDNEGLEPGLTVGLRHLAFAAIDELELTFMGNLVFKTRKLTGSVAAQDNRAPIIASEQKTPAASFLSALFKQPRPDTTDAVLKIPFGIASLADQKRLVERVRAVNGAVTVNQRLAKKLASPELKGAQYIQSLGVVFLAVVLLDVGYTTFSYLEMAKDLYLSKQAALRQPADRVEAERLYARSTRLYEQLLPFSWVSEKLLKHGKIAADLLEDQSQTLWIMGKHDEAIAKLQRAVKVEPKNFRLALALARRLAQSGNLKEARLAVDQAIENHKSAFLPRLYMLAVVSRQRDGRDLRRRLLKVYEEELDEDTFGEEPTWPPSGRRYIADVTYRDDLHFVYNRLLDLGDDDKQ